MLAQKIPTIGRIPDAVRRTFQLLPEPTCEEEELFREVVARAVLDAVGITGLASYTEHNAAVRGARRWFKFGDDAFYIFYLAGINYNPRTMGSHLQDVRIKYKGE